jgi:8-oxo-dGTP diphosphatase
MGNDDIYKAAGIIIQNRKLLVERSTGKPCFVAPGGKLEAGETYPQALVRELKEEFQIDVDEADLELFGSYSDEAANHPGRQVHEQVYMVKRWQGEPTPDHEVEIIHWLTSSIPADMKVGSIIGYKILPELHARGLVD